MRIKSEVIKTQDGLQLRSVEHLPGTTEKHATFTVGRPSDPEVFGSHARVAIGVSLVNPNGAQPREVSFDINETQSFALALSLIGDNYQVVAKSVVSDSTFGALRVFSFYCEQHEEPHDFQYAKLLYAELLEAAKATLDAEDASNSDYLKFKNKKRALTSLRKAFSACVGGAP